MVKGLDSHSVVWFSDFLNEAESLKYLEALTVIALCAWARCLIHITQGTLGVKVHRFTLGSGEKPEATFATQAYSSKNVKDFPRNQEIQITSC